MKNLFEYATKELSQDAFLRWLLENYNDAIVGRASKKFINAFIQSNVNRTFDINSIKSISTISQYKHIDILVTIELNDNRKYKIIIEDKTGSLPHDDQLNKYPEFVNKSECDGLFKIYYKTDCIFEAEREEVVNVAKWTLFDIDMINNVFEEFINCDDEILTFYANYIHEKYIISKEVSSKKPINWSFEEWNAYFNLQIKKIIDEKFGDKLIMYNKIYRGKVLCLRLYFSEIFYDKHQPLIEFAVDKTINAIRSKIFIETKKSNNKYSWKIKEIDNRFLDLVRNKQDTDKSLLYRKLDRVEAIASKIEPLNKNMDISAIEKNIVISCEYFLNFFNDIKLRLNYSTI